MFFVVIISKNPSWLIKASAMASRKSLENTGNMMQIYVESLILSKYTLIGLANSVMVDFTDEAPLKIDNSFKNLLGIDLKNDFPRIPH